MPFRRFFLACLPVLALAACNLVPSDEDDEFDSSGSGDFGSVDQRPGDFASFAEAQALLSQFEPGALIGTRTPESGLVGDATYAGALAFEQPGSDPEVIGKLTMTADLDNRTLMGSADNFVVSEVGSDGSYVQGFVTFNGGRINSDGTFDGLFVNGSVGGDALVISSRPQATGEFRGENAEQLTGEFFFSYGPDNWIGRMGAAKQ